MRRPERNPDLGDHDPIGAAGFGIADGLSFAATPGFALMALLTAAHGTGPADVLCSAARNASPIGGMPPMYLLMAAFHSAPWLKLILRQGLERPQK